MEYHRGSVITESQGELGMNEPVGYVYSVAGEPIKSAKINPEIPNGTPLYTHPAKTLTLTDDEVMDLWNEMSSHPADFARAILRKAQE
jgi:hypothetical protein